MQGAKKNQVFAWKFYNFFQTKVPVLKKIATLINSQTTFFKNLLNRVQGHACWPYPIHKKTKYEKSRNCPKKINAPHNTLLSSLIWWCPPVRRSPRWRAWSRGAPRWRTWRSRLRLTRRCRYRWGRLRDWGCRRTRRRRCRGRRRATTPAPTNRKEDSSSSSMYKEKKNDYTVLPCCSLPSFIAIPSYLN